MFILVYTVFPRMFPNMRFKNKLLIEDEVLNKNSVAQIWKIKTLL